MRAEKATIDTQITSISHPADVLRAEVRKSFNEGTRRGFLQKSLGVTGVALAGGSMAHAGGPTLPCLYSGWNAKNFSQIRTDENAHVAFLVNALGNYARPEPAFKNLVQPDAVTFAKTSFVLENTGVGAYLAAAPIIYNSEYLAAAASILTIEARHAGYLGVLFNETTDLNGSSFDHPISIQTVINNASPFLAGLNGGPPLTFSTTPSAENDVAILNFALALEYLEREYYNTNVHRFFGV